jgi:nicotinamide-nucleotide amidase
MVEGAGRELLVDAAVSTTGAGGPDAEEGHPPGTLYVGVLVRGRLACHKLRIEGDPGEVVESATEQALGLLLHAMSEAVDRIEAQPEEPARDLVS